ncbi:unnamed protein product [Allacma fusca]|uniref:Uncharacterized protein n=1 Tax=Allacma fusca TaxID=39272 RepID=A0A8J2KQZ9_9HEXA|nr:unnamed protein product [Allacma fusca]
MRAVGNVDLNGGQALPAERVLGLYWNASADEFCFNFKCPRVDAAVVNGTKIPTKREVLKLLMSLFDPLGFLAHFLIKGKILFQQIWRTGLGWDDSLSEMLMQSWKTWLAALADASKMTIPRCYHPNLQVGTNIQLHTFVDASEEAFAAVCYLRLEVDGGVAVSFVTAKTKVAPLKPLSIPRMELQAAVLGVRIAKIIKMELQLNVTECLLV